MKRIYVIGFFIVSILGTAFHFLYNYIPIFIFPKNESIFEHLKLILYPFLIYIGASLFFVKEHRQTYFSYLLGGMVVAMVFTIVCYYTYSGFIGKNIDFINILIYFISVFIGFLLAYLKKIPLGSSNSILYLLLIFVLFIIWTYYPPNLAFFRG